MKLNALSTSQNAQTGEFFPLERFHSGDQSVFKNVFDRLGKQILFYVIGHFSIQKDFADDIVAEAFLKLYKHRQKMESYEHIKRWIYIITRNLCIDYIRDKKQQRLLTEAILFTSPEIEDEELSLEMMKGAILSKMWEDINALPKQQKQVILLYFFEHKSTHEIAEIMGINSQTALNHKTRAINQLKFKIFEDEYNVEDQVIADALKNNKKINYLFTL